LISALAKQQRAFVPGDGEPEALGAEVEHPDEHGHKMIFGHVRDQNIVEPRGHVPRMIGDLEQGAKGRAGVGHQQGRADAVAGYVADGQPQPPAGQPKKIVVVAPRFRAGLVPTLDLEGLKAGRGLGKKPKLDAPRNGELLAHPTGVQQFVYRNDLVVGLGHALSQIGRRLPRIISPVSGRVNGASR
jgi:hypothetical protein